MAGLYVHIPSHRNRRSTDRSAFVRALAREFDRSVPHSIQESIRTVYVGGRPSLRSLGPTDPIVDALRTTMDSDSIEEATVEITPPQVYPQHLNVLRQMGATRLSIEAISFVEDDLAAVDASYSVDELVGTIDRVWRRGFRSFSVDLHFGTPGQSLSNWKASLQRAVELRVPHIALHEFDPTDEPRVESEKRAECLAFAMTFLRAKGYERYELTHFARPRHRSRHQEHYYAHGNYLGLGPGAESFWWSDRSANTTALRWSNVDDTESYAECLTRGETPVAQRETVDRGALAREYVLLRLRTNEGLNLDVLDTQYGVDLSSRKSSTLQRLAEEGLIHDDPERVRLTHRGCLLADAITLRLLPSSSP